MSKPKAIKNYEKLPINIKKSIKLKYPYSFKRDLISIVDHKGKKIKVLPYETEDKYYLVRISESYFYSNDEILFEESTNEVIDLGNEELEEEMNKAVELDINSVE